MLKTTRGPAREEIGDLGTDKVSSLKESGTLIFDDRRLRSLYFDGRFLTAKDLTREQTYFLTRQADLCRAGGAGVVAGLDVRLVQAQSSITITEGHGITPAGELVVLSETLQGLKLDDIATVQRLDAAFGLSPIPREAARNRSGLYILALRPVEYTANPVASYPTTLGGARTIHDGDIIEGVAVTLIPYPDRAVGGTLDQQRARVAHDIFVRAAPRTAPVNVLPLAMIALDHGVPIWVDPFLVRREVGSEQTDFLGFGFARRPLREAHLLQYDRHLDDVLSIPQVNRRMSASEHFFALPPAGRMPSAAMDTTSFTQVFFPPEVEVELSIIADDELGALLDESLLLPPIDLTLSGEDLDATSVLVLIPVPRHLFEETVKIVGTSAKLAPAALPEPNKSLSALTLGWSAPLAAAIPAEFSASGWAAVLTTHAPDGFVWYARRRNLKHTTKIGEAVLEPSAEQADEPSLSDRLGPLTLTEELSEIVMGATVQGLEETTRLLASPRVVASRALLAGAVCEMYAKGSPFTLEKARTLAARYSDPELGQGLLGIQECGSTPWSATVDAALARTGRVTKLHETGRSLGTTDLSLLAADLLQAENPDPTVDGGIQAIVAAMNGVLDKWNVDT